MYNCIDKYRKIFDDDYNNIENFNDESCFQRDFYTGKKVTNVEHPLIEKELCKLISNKRHEKYIYSYDGKSIIDDLYKDHGENEYIDEYVNKLSEVIDMSQYENCCKCISIVLYSLGNIEKYLFSILRTVKNAEKYLPEWIIRLYFDNSVHNFIMQNDRLKDDYMRIIESPSVEIYTYLCKDFLGIDTKDDLSSILSRTRMLRFLTMIDSTVSTCVIREADGILSLIECMNIKIFDSSKSVFYLSPFNYTEKITSVRSYSHWLNYYKKYMRNEFFSQKTNLFDLLAGLVSVKVKINNQAFYGAKKSLDLMISQQLANIHDSKHIAMLRQDRVDVELVKSYLNIGYDEMFLLELFKNVFSCQYTYTNEYIKTISFDENCEKILLSNIISIENFEMINIMSEIFFIEKENQISRSYEIYPDTMINAKFSPSKYNDPIIDIQYKIQLDDLIKQIVSNVPNNNSINRENILSLTENLNHFFNSKLIKLKNKKIIYRIINIIADYLFYYLFKDSNKLIYYDIGPLINANGFHNFYYPTTKNPYFHNEQLSIKSFDLLNEPIDDGSFSLYVDEVYSILDSYFTPVKDYAYKTNKYIHKINQQVKINNSQYE